VRSAFLAGLFALIGLAVPVGAVVLLLVLTAAVIVVCLRDYRDLSQKFNGIKVRRRLPTVVGRNLPFHVEWTVEGSGQFVHRGAFRDVVPTVSAPRFSLHRLDLLATGGCQTIDEMLRIPVRGLHRFGPVWVRLEGPLRFLEAQQAVECPGQVKVLPEQYASRDELLKDTSAEIVMLDKLTFSRQHGHGTEFESLHEYRFGDDPRRIDWRTTARLRRPIVRRYQIERHRDVMIVIDCGRLMGTETDRGSKLDCAVDSALLLGRVALQSGDRCGLGMFDDQVRGYLPPVTGAASMNALADCVYDAQVAWRESDFTPMFAALQRRQAKRSLIVVLSDVVDAETSEQFRASLLRLQKRHVVLFAALRTPALKRIVSEPVETILDGARKAVTFRLLHERERALHSLHRGGIFVVDVEPTQLTAPLINQFIELRQRNLL
jgi:uncharacterized protein (DUF58 family)